VKRADLEKPPQDRRSGREREIREHRERLRRELQSRRVPLDDANASVALEATPQRCGEGRIELDREHAGTGSAQRSGQESGAGPEVQHEIAVGDPGLTHELVCERAATKCVPTARRSDARAGHGRPSSWASPGF
jgi:hypothetical protein